VSAFFSGPGWSLLLLAVARTMPVVAVAPFGALSRLPSAARPVLALFMALAAVGGVRVGPMPTGGAFALALASNLAIGFLAAMAAFLVAQAVTVIGQAIDASMGWAFVQLFVLPGDVPSPFGVLFSLLGTTLFLSAGGLAFLIGAVLHSFATWPVTRPIAFQASWLHGLVLLGGMAVNYGIQVALPLTTATLVASAVSGAVARLVPQLQVISFEFPLIMLAAIVLVMVSLPTLQATIVALLQVLQSAIQGLGTAAWGL